MNPSLTYDLDTILKIGLPSLALLGIAKWFTKQAWPLIVKQWEDLNAERKANNEALIRALSGVQDGMSSMAKAMDRITDTQIRMENKIDSLGKHK